VVAKAGIVSTYARIALRFCLRWMTIQRPGTFWKLPDGSTELAEVSSGKNEL
jgi:hypothetical protein